MTEAQVATLVLTLRTAFVKGTQMTAPQVRAFELMLIDLDFKSAQTAVFRLVQTSTFLPAIAEVRAAEREVREGPRRTGLDAWGDVGAAVRRYGADGQPRFADPGVAECVRCLGWRELCLGENASSLRARFCDAYDAQATRAARERSVSPALRLEASPVRGLLGAAQGRALPDQRRRRPPQLAAKAPRCRPSGGGGSKTPQKGAQGPAIGKAVRPAMTQAELEQERQRQRALLADFQANETKGTD